MELRNTLQNSSYIHPRHVLIEGLLSKVRDMGNLIVPIEVSAAYPNKETFLHKKDSSKHIPKRFIVIKLINEKPEITSIGDITGSENFNYENLTDRVSLGWAENHLFEISVWSNSITDMDLMRTVVKEWVIELLHRELEDGASKFTRQGVLAFKYLGSTDSVNDKLIDNNGVYHIGVMKWSLISIFNFNHDEQYENFTVNIVAKLASFTG